MSTQRSVLLAVRDGAGTAPAELAVAVKLRERGHQVRVVGPPQVRRHAEERGLPLHDLRWPSELPAGDLLTHMIGAASSWAAQIAPELDGIDVVIADCSMFGVLGAARAAGVPTVSLVPTVYIADLPMFRRPDRAAGAVTTPARAIGAVNAFRESIGLPAVSCLADQILDADRVLLLSPRRLELPSVRPPGHVRYVGPQVPSVLPAAGVDGDGDGDGDGPVHAPTGDPPLILVSLSTSDQDQRDLLQRILSAMADLPVRVLATLGPVDPRHLTVPQNASVAAFVPHNEVLPEAAAVVTHAGHGTVMAALSAGAPMVCLPMGRDQPAVGARVQHHGVGLVLPPDADTADLRAAVEVVLSDPGYRRRAWAFVRSFEAREELVAEIEALLDRVSGPRSPE